MDFSALSPTAIYTQYAPVTAFGTPESCQQLTCRSSNSSPVGIQKTKATYLLHKLLPWLCHALCLVGFLLIASRRL